MPDNLFEQIFVIGWNMVIILVGIVLIWSASPAENEKIMRYLFLPVVYGLYGMRLGHMYRKVKGEIPGILANWCRSTS